MNFHLQKSVSTTQAEETQSQQQNTSTHNTSQHSIMSDIDYLTVTKSNLAAVGSLQPNLIRSTGNMAAYSSTKLDIPAVLSANEVAQKTKISSDSEVADHQQSASSPPNEGQTGEKNSSEDVAVITAVSSGEALSA